jgi:E3 ubiquitin-protein ligase HUWE1
MGNRLHIPFTNYQDHDFSSKSCPKCNKIFFETRDLEKHKKACLKSKKLEKNFFFFYSDGDGRVSDNFSNSNAKFERIRIELDRIRIPWSISSIKLTIGRENIVEGSIEKLIHLSDADIRKEFSIIFDGEVSNDAGGLTKEWLSLFIKNFITDAREFFVRTNTDKISYIVPTYYNKSFCTHYEIFGKMLGKCLLDNVPVRCHLNLIVFKSLVGRQPDYEDLKHVDTELYRALEFMKTSNIDGVFFETFSLEKECAGKRLCWDLKPGGRSIEVCEENKIEFIELRSRFEVSSIQEALETICEGFFSVVPKNLIERVSVEELEQLLCGNPTIDLNEWKEFTEYSGCYSVNHPVIKNFWNVLSEFSQDQLQKLLQFVTGASQVPIQGFQELKSIRGNACKFTIVSVEYYQNLLPQAHTCFNRLDLPIYPSKDLMKGSLEFITKYEFSFGIE